MNPERHPWMPWVQQPQERPNRAARRRATRTEAGVLHDQLVGLDIEFHRTANHFDRVGQEQGHRFGRIVYQGDPFVDEYLVACRKLHFYLEKAQWVSLKRSFAANDHLNQVDAHDLFSVKVAGTSLSDIEQMPLPLSTDDIKRINKMWHEPFLGKSKNQERLVKHSMIYLATQSQINSDKNSVSPELSPLAKRLTNYVDYYTNLMTDFSLNDEDEMNFLMTLVWGGDHMIRDLGCYIPARLSITPSSAIKLYYQRAESSLVSNFGWRVILKKMADESQYAFLKDGLPEDLKDFCRYNPKMDNQAMVNLLGHYRGRGLGGFEEARELTESSSLLERLNSNRNIIHREIRRSQDKRLNFKMPENHVVSGVTVTSQNRESLIFILHFKDGQSYLTLEVDKNNKLYGMPPKLSSEYPHLSDLVLMDVLGPILVKVAPKPVVVKRSTEPILIPAPREETNESQETVESEEREEKRKRKVMRELVLPRMNTREPELPIPHEQAKRQYSVIHSRESVEEELGKKRKPDDVDRIMETIRRFEYGQVPVKTIVWSEGKRQVIRKGKYRIILNHLGNGLYQIENVADREYVYEGYSDHRVY